MDLKSAGPWILGAAALAAALFPRAVPAPRAADPPAPAPAAVVVQAPAPVVVCASCPSPAPAPPTPPAPAPQPDPNEVPVYQLRPLLAPLSDLRLPPLRGAR